MQANAQRADIARGEMSNKIFHKGLPIGPSQRGNARMKDARHCTTSLQGVDSTAIDAAKQTNEGRILSNTHQDVVAAKDVSDKNPTVGQDSDAVLPAADVATTRTRESSDERENICKEKVERKTWEDQLRVMAGVGLNPGSERNPRRPVRRHHARDYNCFKEQIRVF